MSIPCAYARTVPAANAQYALGQLYETRFTQYDSARVFYDRGRSAPPQAEVAPLLVRGGYPRQVSGLPGDHETRRCPAGAPNNTPQELAYCTRPVPMPLPGTPAPETQQAFQGRQRRRTGQADSASVLACPRRVPGFHWIPSMSASPAVMNLPESSTPALAQPHSTPDHRLLLADFPESRPAPRALYTSWRALRRRPRAGRCGFPLPRDRAPIPFIAFCPDIDTGMWPPPVRNPTRSRGAPHQQR